MFRRHGLAIIMAVIAFIGFAEASFLAIEHFRGVVPPCTIIQGCAAVATSPYAVILGVPVALLGSLYYLAVLLLTIAYLESGKEWPLLLAVLLTPFGLIASAYFVFLQLFVIKAICIYCMGSALSSTLLFVFALIAWNTRETLREKLHYIWKRWREKI